MPLALSGELGFSVAGGLAVIVTSGLISIFLLGVEELGMQVQRQRVDKWTNG